MRTLDPRRSPVRNPVLPAPPASFLHRLAALYGLIGLYALATGCTPEPRPIAYGTDGCAQCRMQIADDRFAAQIVMRTGKTFLFDSATCMAAFLDDGSVEGAAVHSLWVVDFMQPGPLIPVETAFFLQSDLLHSPMGQHVTAFGPGMTPMAARNAFGGKVLTWAEVRALAPAHDHRVQQTREDQQPAHPEGLPQ